MRLATGLFHSPVGFPWPSLVLAPAGLLVTLAALSGGTDHLPFRTELGDRFRPPTDTRRHPRQPQAANTSQEGTPSVSTWNMRIDSPGQPRRGASWLHGPSRYVDRWQHAW